MEHAIARDLPENIMKVIKTWMGSCEFTIIYFWEDNQALTFFVVIHAKDQIKCLRVFKLSDKEELSIDCLYKLQQQSRGVGMGDKTDLKSVGPSGREGSNPSLGMNLFITFARLEHTQELTNVGSFDTVDVIRDNNIYQRFRVFDLNGNVIFTCDSIKYVKKIEFEHL